MKSSVAVVGGGILGSWVARLAEQAGYPTTLFTKNTHVAFASLAAGGLLCPFTELESSEKEVTEMGKRSFPLWDELYESAPHPFVYHKQGTLTVHHREDANQTAALKQRLAHYSLEACYQSVDSSWLNQNEPTLARNFGEALYFPKERNLEAITALHAVREAFTASGGTLLAGEGVASVAPHSIVWKNERQHYDWVIDCRGIDAKKDLPQLRGVRGERVTLYAPDVTLRHTVRLLHPVTPLYIAPLDQGRFIVGATSIESEDHSPFKVRSMLEILSAAFSVDSAFAEADILESWVAHRPAFPDNLPQMFFEDGLIRVNGLYRHGYLLAPAVATDVVQRLSTNERAV